MSARSFAETVAKELERRIAEVQFRLRKGMSDIEELQSCAERDQFHMRLQAYYAIIVAEGVQMGRNQILDEQAEEKAKKARAKKRKAKRKP